MKPQSGYVHGLNMDYKNPEPLDMNDYRSTPKGQKIVPEILVPGTIVRTSYGEREYRVLRVTGPYTESSFEETWIYPPHYSISLCDVEDWKKHKSKIWKHPSRLAGINEVVAIDGRLLKLFKSNEDEVIIISQPEKVEGYEQFATSGEQLSMF